MMTFDDLESIDEILSLRFKDFKFHKLKDIPHFRELKNSIEASKLVVDKMAKRHKILIAGDYDSDGVCATCIMLDFFDKIGYKNVVSTMPNRFKHGYGFSQKLLEEILHFHDDISLVITVDNGVSSFDAGKICKEKGIKFIITDHHTIEKDENGIDKIPQCDFMINPMQKSCNFPFKEICGSFVAWYFCNAIKHSLLENLNNRLLHIKDLEHSKKVKNKIKRVSDIDMKSLLPLVGIATISDVMTLNELNHTICKYAIDNFYKFDRPAFHILEPYLKDSITSQSFGFKIAPLLNSAGRLDDGNIALEFLRAKNLQDAKVSFSKLKSLNAKRKEVQNEVCKNAKEFALNNIKNPHLMLSLGKNWHEGVLGIAAGKLADEFNKPSFVLTNINGIYKGSGRSGSNVDLISSIQKIGDLFSRYGGHAGAVGLEIQECNIDLFVEKFEPIFLDGMEVDKSTLGYINADIVNKDLLDTIDKYEPYGAGNERPIFRTSMNIVDAKATTMGFLELKLKCNNMQNRFLKAMYFEKDFDINELQNGCEINFSFSICVDNFNSQKEIEIMAIINKIYSIRAINK